MRKRDEKFFKYVIDTEKINMDETLFVDDGPRNVAVAERIGIHTFCPENGKDWTAEIYKHLL